MHVGLIAAKTSVNALREAFLGTWTEFEVVASEGPWAVLADASYVLASDEEKLAALSGRVGTVVSFVVETAGGCASFWCFENGRLRRKIDNVDGVVTAEGTPFVEEAGIDVGRYYIEESEALGNAIGVSLCYEDAADAKGWQAVCVVDQTDYGPALEKGIGETKARKKPWWRFW